MSDEEQARSYSNALHISQAGKGIPYGGSGELREDRDANYGFKNLRCHLERIADIPELVRDEVMRECATLLNDPASAFGTIGCVSTPIDEKRGHRVSGYVEFAFDSAEKIADAGSYFLVFFHFDRALHDMGFDDKVHYHWALMSGTFVFARASGFTMTVTVNTGWYETAEDADIAWANGLDFLAGYLRHVPPAGGTPIFNDG